MADLIVQHRFCSDAAFGFAARPRRACGLLMRGRLAETATRRSVALSLCRHHAASRCGLRSGQRDRSRRFASNRARRTAFRRPCSTCSTSSLPRKQVALLRLFGLAPGQTRSVFYSRPHERRSATALRARNRPRGDDSHGLGRPRQKVVANRPEALPRRPAPIARTCRPRGGRTEGGTFAPARLRHMQGAKRRTPLAIRNIVRERTHRPARALRPILGFRRASASRPSSLAPRAGEPSADNDGPRAQTDSPRGHARLFRRRNRQRASALPPPAHRVIARDPPRPRSTPDNTPAADPGTRPSRAADTRAHRDRIRPSRSPRRADRIRRSSRRPRPR